MAAPLITFPFERDRTHTFGELRAFERDLSAARQANPALSKEWRVPSTDPMKEAAKVREETFPLMLLADLKGYPDSSTFRLMPYGFPKIDAAVKTEADKFDLQITTADPIWLRPDGSPSNGGYDERLVREALNNAGVVQGLAAMRRDNGIIVSGKPMRSFDEEFEACARGIETTLKKKIISSSSQVRLLVHARDYCIHAVDFPFSRVVNKAFDLIGRSKLEVAYGAYYFVDEGSRIFFEHSCQIPSTMA